MLFPHEKQHELNVCTIHFLFHVPWGNRMAQVDAVPILVQLCSRGTHEFRNPEPFMMGGRPCLIIVLEEDVIFAILDINQTYHLLQSETPSLSSRVVHDPNLLERIIPHKRCSWLCLEGVQKCEQPRRLSPKHLLLRFLTAMAKVPFEKSMLFYTPTLQYMHVCISPILPATLFLIIRTSLILIKDFLKKSKPFVLLSMVGGGILGFTLFFFNLFNKYLLFGFIVDA